MDRARGLEMECRVAGGCLSLASAVIELLIAKRRPSSAFSQRRSPRSPMVGHAERGQQFSMPEHASHGAIATPGQTRLSRARRRKGS